MSFKEIFGFREEKNIAHPVAPEQPHLERKAPSATKENWVELALAEQFNIPPLDTINHYKRAVHELMATDPEFKELVEQCFESNGSPDPILEKIKTTLDEKLSQNG